MFAASQYLIPLHILSFPIGVFAVFPCCAEVTSSPKCFPSPFSRELGVLRMLPRCS